ncbi:MULTISPECIES: 30S ribosomal protein S9 [unclassified Aureispira]|uniref:30S ribosomal protein S9 n=1 Tax=unclassified Aureispira TaxID=2649989 RepID=UPI000695E09E|nr:MULTISPECIES: 30S ribosomal protein S9 [unclassified Aureispira]WMX14890.1 30S ribosomal protein S9 [Aureispira sp. CCB-E]
MEIINGLGRRKAAVARVYLKQGSGNVVVNGKDYKEYFPVEHVQGKILEPLTLVDVLSIYDLKVNVRGGGIKGQAEAVRLGIARALCKINEEFREPLKAAKLLSRDSRVVERKKYGKPKARKSFQFSKR